MKQRTREIIKELNYSELEKGGYIPILSPHVNNKIVKYPPFVYKNKSYALFGVFIEYVVKKMMSKFLNVNFSNKNCLAGNYYKSEISWENVLEECYTLASLDMQLTGDFPEELKKTRIFNNIYKFLSTSCVSNLTDVRFEEEFSYNNILSHPDIVAKNFVIDVKSTCNFSKMYKDSFLQILTYYAVLNSIGISTKYAGILLPLQRDVILFDLDNWNFKPFLNLIIEKSNKISQPIKINPNCLSFIGSHIHKLTTLTDSIETYVQKVPLLDNFPPCQMFLRSPKNGKTPSYSDDDIKNSRILIENLKLKYFTHTPYIVNLCHPSTIKNPKNDKWSLDLVKDDLRITRIIGGMGVIIHVGKSKDSNIQNALDKMEQSIRYILTGANSECPLILETPAGEGTELCTDIESLSNFYNRFSTDDKKIFKICIDTCHVYASDYDPLDYINKWVNLQGIESLRLVHFNDSKEHKGSKLDRHAPYGFGYIGVKKMLEIANWLYEKGIPVVVE